MSKQFTITLSHIQPIKITIQDESSLNDWSNIMISIPYNILEDTNRIYDKGIAAFFETMPSGNNPNWYPLPPKYADPLRNAILDAIKAIETREEII